MIEAAEECRAMTLPVCSLTTGSQRPAPYFRRPSLLTMFL